MQVTQPYLGQFPFLSGAKEEVGDVDMTDILENNAVLRRATERVVRGVNTGTVSSLSSHPGVYNPELEGDLTTQVFSYPVARIIVSLIGDFRIINRYARAEAKTATIRFRDHQLTESETTDSIFHTKIGVSMDEMLGEFGLEAIETELKDELDRTYIGTFFEEATLSELREFATRVFNISSPETLLTEQTLAGASPADIYTLLAENGDTATTAPLYRIPLESYLQTAVSLNEPQWRLTNRGVHNGTLVIERGEVFEMIEEAIYQRVKENLPLDIPDAFREKMTTATPYSEFDDSTVPSYWEDIPRTHEQVPNAEYNFIELVRAAIKDEHFSYQIDRVEPGLFPPVIDRLLDGVRNGENLIHEARFTLVAFFINIGMSPDEIVDMLQVGGSFGEEPTRYQVNHIMAGGGNGEPYTPANYPTMDAWGIEWERDALEAKVQNPLTYYKIKLQDADESEKDTDETDTEADDTDSESKRD
jgi:DNA primase large subunit